MRKTDYNFGDTLAGEMEKIMNSDEHKQLFNKTAQDWKPDFSTGVDPNAPEYKRSLRDHDPTLSSPTGVGNPNLTNRQYNPKGGQGGTGEPMTFGDPGASDQDVDMAILEQKAKRLVDNYAPDDPSAPMEKIMVAQKLLSGQTLSPEEKALLKSAQQVPPFQKYPVSKSEWDKLRDDQKAKLRDTDGPPPWEKKKKTASNLLETLVKVADYLGQKGYTVSEAAADRLINTLILEAAKKEKKEKKEKECKECKECKKPCDKCKCDDKKKKDDKKK